MTWLGELGLWVAVLMAAWGTSVGVAAALQRRGELAASAGRATLVAAVSLTLATAGLWDALVGVDGSVRYAARWAGANMPVGWRLAAAWAGPEGRLLLWAWLIAIAGAVAARREWRARTVAAAWTTAVVAMLVLAATVLSALGANPFVRLAFEPPDGGALPPLLREAAFLWQPPLVLIGLALTAPVAALAIGMRLTVGGHVAEMARLRRWAAAAWTFLSVGLGLAAWWSWRARGEDERWLVDTLASPAMVAWLVLSAALHAIVAGERDERRRPRALGLAAAAWFATVPAALLPPTLPWEGGRSLTPGGFTVGTWLLVLLGAASVALVPRRREDATSDGTRPEGLVGGGRVAALGGAAVLMVALAAALAALLARTVAGGASSLGAGAAWGVSAALVLLVVLAAASVVLPWRGRARDPWRRLLLPAALAVAATVALAPDGAAPAPIAALGAALFGLAAAALAAVRALRARRGAPAGELPVADLRRIAGLVAHAGTALVLVGFAGASARTRHEVTLGAGESTSLRDPFGLHWEVVGQGISRYDAESREVMALAVELRQGSAAPRLVTSELRQYYDARGIPLGDVLPVSGTTVTPLEDVRVALLDAPSEERVRLRVTFAPLLWLAWAGAALMAAGGALALMPAPRAERASDPTTPVAPPSGSAFAHAGDSP
jgi:cytochrome c-type biogenesis protein CcmF